MASTFDQLQIEKVWDGFTRNGVTDTLTILEYLSAIFAGARPPELPFSRMRALDQLVMELKLGREFALGAFLNDHLFFVRQARYSTALFPLPRHLAGTMVRCVEVGRQARVLDLACGTGGLLVAAARAGAPEVQGRDIHERLVRIAQHNLQLNAKDAAVFVDRADATNKQGASTSVTPNVVLLAPPFGAPTFDKTAAQEDLAHPVSRIEVALSEMALQKLEDGGKGAILTLGRLLGGGDSNERRFRQDLVKNYRLKGIAQLPETALQPYSSTQVYLLVVEKRNPNSDDAVWFAAIRRDGYSRAKGERRLTVPPNPEYNDYPLLEALLTYSVIPRGNRPLSEDSGPLVTVANIPVDAKGEGPGMHVVNPVPGLWLKAGRLYTEGDQRKLILTVSAPDEGNRGRFVSVPLGVDELSVEIAQMPPGGSDLLFHGPIPGGAIAVSREGVLMAVSRSQAILIRQHESTKDVDLRPETYLPQAPIGIAAQRSPDELLARIQSSHRELGERLALLIGQVSRSDMRQGTRPQVLDALKTDKFPMGKASRTQAKVWKAIQALEKATTGESGPARFFAYADLADRATTVPASELGATLDLLCAIGAIVPVTLRGIQGYRLVTTWDEWKPARTGERGMGTSAPEKTDHS